MKRFRPFLSLRSSLTVLMIAGTTGAARAEMLTLTDQFGRSIKADVLSVENDKATIRRDDGQTFELPLANLSETSQQELKAFKPPATEARPASLSAAKVELKLSRARFSVEKKEDEDGALVTSREKWGYNVDFTNRSPRELKNVRLEYILYVKQDEDPGQTKEERAEKPKRQKFHQTLELVPVHGTKTVRTDAVDIFRQQLKPGWVWKGVGGNKPIRDTLYGIWLRAYEGDQLIYETSAPETLAKKDTW